MTAKVFQWQKEGAVKHHRRTAPSGKAGLLFHLQRLHRVLQNQPAVNPFRCHSTKKTTTPPGEEKVFSAKIIIDKYDGTNTAAKLSGAKFVLRCKSVTETTGTGTKPN